LILRGADGPGLRHRFGRSYLLLAAAGTVLLPTAMHGQSLQQAGFAGQSTLPTRTAMLQAASHPVPETGTDSGTISGDVADPNGNALVTAHVKLKFEGKPAAEEAGVDAQGHYVLEGIGAGSFVLTVSAEGFRSHDVTGVINSGQAMVLPQVVLPIAVAATEIQVRVTNYELAEEQVKQEETQRVLGVIPNFYVTYQHNPLPLKPRQKFELAWKSSIDPVSIAFAAVYAGVEQDRNSLRGYGRGAQGYAKRFGASYADEFISNMIGGAILPSILKQDPRYYYKGTGTVSSRFWYALANAVICKGDNGRWQTNYSGILGSLAAGGISNVYYPSSSRDGVKLTFENTLFGIGGSGVGNLFQEFLVRKLTPHAGKQP
jgi:hypothetical protein